MARKTEIILGIDPGTVVMGYGLIKIENGKTILLEMGVLKLSQYKDANVRLQLIYNKIGELFRNFKPTQFAIEAPFFGKNVQSMLKLGRAQGVAIAAAMQVGLSATEYSPKKIKQSITGNGNASKEQVWKMLQQTLQFTEKPEFLDASDALAVALCHFYQSNEVIGTKDQYKDWEGFLKNNAHRIKK
ncbi:MAG: crossover junction endodeoxyribonuclease RuvC [Chitinophagaceae bacterium]|nr:crossover junction endodeoxyribonuclease RuvC [Chitinophagaceae bacterium]